MRASKSRRTLVAVFVVMLMTVGMNIPASAASDVAQGADPSLYTPPFALGFPLEGRFGFSDSFGAIRDGGSRLHQGIDISAPKTTPVLAAATGVVTRVDEGVLAGLYVEIQHADGWYTRYLHLNNDEPPPASVVEPACDAVPPEETAADDVVADDTAVPDPEADDSAPDKAPAEEPTCTEEPVVEVPPTWGVPAAIVVGARVAAGDVIGFVGTSGNASSAAPHLHFEVRMPDGTPVNPYPILTGRTSPRTLFVLPEVTDDPVVSSINVIGHVEPTGGFNADVWVHSGVAYLTTLGRGEACPASGVRRFDVTDPSSPDEMETLSEEYPGTSTEAVWVGQVDTDRFSGDLAVVAHQLCDPDDGAAFRGLAFYDVTDPLLPVQLGTYGAGAGTLGVHAFDVWLDDGQVLVLAAVPNSYLEHPNALGDVRIVDITNPANPVAVADWDFRRDTIDGDTDPWGLSPDAQVVLSGGGPDDADLRDLRVETVSVDPDGERAFVALWDAGVAVLDLSDPSQPEIASLITSPAYHDGATYSTAFDSESGVLVVNHRNLDPLGDDDTDTDVDAATGSWGVSVVFDESGQDDRTVASVHSVEEALPDVDGRLVLDGLYTPQEAVVAGDYLYAIWLSGGLRVVDLSDATEPVEVASFVPPTRVDPQRYFASPNGNIAMPLAWSVHVVDNLIYVSDANTGLWILRLSEPPIGRD